MSLSKRRWYDQKLLAQWPKNIVPRLKWEPRWVYGLRYRRWLRPWKAELRERVVASLENS